MNSSAFVEFSLANNALMFGEFTLKSGRVSPYFFNAGKFNSGYSFDRLGRFYADALMQSGIEFDMLFGPAYKGIPLATATSIALSREHQRSVCVTFNRKEEKTHGETGKLMGAPLAGRVVIVDDVITAGTAIRQSMSLIEQAGAQPVAVIVALDRQEVGPNGKSAIQEIEQVYNIPVIAIARLDDLLEYAHSNSELSSQLKVLTAYRQSYGIK